MRDLRPATRGDFLKTLAMGAGVAALGSSSSVAAVPDARRGYVVAVTHGPSDPTRVMLALFSATRLPTGDNHLWFAIDAGQLCKKGEAEKVISPLFPKQGTAAKLIAQVRDKGTAIHI